MLLAIYKRNIRKYKTLPKTRQPSQVITDILSVLALNNRFLEGIGTKINKLSIYNPSNYLFAKLL